MDKVGVISEADGYQSVMTVSGLAEVLKVAMRGIFTVNRQAEKLGLACIAAKGMLLCRHIHSREGTGEGVFSSSWASNHIIQLSADPGNKASEGHNCLRKIMNSPKDCIDLTYDASLGDAKGQENGKAAPVPRPVFQAGQGRK